MSMTRKLAAAFGLAAAAQVAMMFLNVGGIDRGLWDELDRIEKARPMQSVTGGGLGGSRFPLFSISLYTLKTGYYEDCLYQVDANLAFGQLVNVRTKTDCRPELKKADLPGPVYTF